MKLIFVIFTLFFAITSIAQNRSTIDDLKTISLNIDAQTTKIYDINYPNYRLGGGTPPRKKINDCLMLDIKHSDVAVTVKEKLKLAESLKVLEGFNLSEDDSNGKELQPTIKGRNIIFLISPGMLYMTFLQVRSRDSRTLNEVIEENLPEVRPGNSSMVPVGFVYVRDCRF